MSDWLKKYRSFIFRMVNFVIFFTIIIFIFGTVITGKFWLPDLLEDFVYVSGCTLYTSILLHWLYDRIYRLRRFLFFIVFALISSTGVGLGLTIGTLILYGRFIYGINFLLAILLGILASAGNTFYEVQKSRLEENIARLKAAELENEQLKRFESEARFNSLQAKLNPHFLFNTLNSLAALVYEDPKKTEQSIVRLSELYRRILSVSNQTFITVKEELGLIEDYLELEKLRFEGHLSYQFECSKALQDRSIPGLLIEPLVENVIKHVLDKKEDTVQIHIKISESNGMLHLKVTDNGPGFDVKSNASGYGLSSIQERLQLLYEDNYHFDIRSKAGEGTSVEIGIPVG